MRLSFATIRTLFGAELRMLLRDGRMIVLSILLPLAVMPIFLLASHWTMQKREHTLQQTVYRYAVIGPRAEIVRAILAGARQRAGAGETAAANSRFRLDAVPCTNAFDALSRGNIQVVLEGLKAPSVHPAASNVSPGMLAPHDGVDAAGLTSTGGTTVRIIFRGDRDDSAAAMNLVRATLWDERRAQQAELLLKNGFPVKPSEVAVMSAVNVASKGHVAGLVLGRFLTLFLLLFILSGGAVAATDSVVGEKERGTLETLLSTAASREEIAIAKHLLILAVALTITVIQAANLLVYVGFKLIPLGTGFAAAIPPPIGLLLFFLFLPVAALASSALLLTSSCAKSYKEAQLYFFPVLLLGLVPAFAPLLPGLSLRSAIVLVPVANIAVAAKEILIGVFDWPMIVVSWLATAAVAAWVTQLSVRALSSENLITSTETDAVEFAGGPALFSRRVLLWYGLLWSALIMMDDFLAAMDVRLELGINMLAFLGAAVLMIRRYQLDLRQTLALRVPKPAVWIAVLVAAPSGLLTGIGLFRLASLVVPVPSKVIEGFSQSVLPEGIPFWQLILFLGILPGAVEEIAFRGLLLHGLHRRLHPVALALVVGLVFGLFHVVLFRLAPAIFLGILLAVVTMLTGSIFPAVLWHILNNILAILPITQQLPLTQLNPAGYLIATGMLAAAFWILWRNRTPYPGLRPWRRHRQSTSAAVRRRGAEAFNG